jgi:folate-binding protein YgfZ
MSGADAARQQAAAVRRGAGLFRLEDRALLAVSGEDRVRWLDGMLSSEVRSLSPERTGSYSVLLTRTGRVVTDLHVLWRPEAFWLELAADALAPTCAHLEKFIIADDVSLRDLSGDWERLALEGPAAPGVLAAALPDLPELEPDACADLPLDAAEVRVAAFGWSGESAFQIFAPRGRGDALAQRLLAAGAEQGLVPAGPEALEILRVEAGIPRYGAELDESVLPDEAGLGRAVSTRKGCYTGQEVVARLRSQGQVSYQLVGLRSEDGAPPEPGAEVSAGGRKVGEVTSACVSPSAGAIALAFVRRAHAAPGTELRAGERSVRVAALPFVAGS